LRNYKIFGALNTGGVSNGLHSLAAIDLHYGDGEQVERVFDTVDKRLLATDPLKYAFMLYDALHATGGFYREVSDGRGLLTLMGISWSAIRDSVEDPARLPPAHARHLLAVLETRPFTKAMLLGEERGELNGMIRFNMERSGQDPDLPLDEADFSDEEIAKGCEFYAKRRRQLMALLRAAIERDEALKMFI
jgi:hypothetical protein